jgi:hypothetical protein
MSSERLQCLNVELILSPEEIIAGGIVPVAVPVFFACPQCSGTGRDGFSPCMNCNARRVIEGERTVSLSIPPWVPDRTIIEVPIHGLGIHKFYLIKCPDPYFAVSLSAKSQFSCSNVLSRILPSWTFWTYERLSTQFRSFAFS